VWDVTQPAGPQRRSPLSWGLTGFPGEDNEKVGRSCLPRRHWDIPVRNLMMRSSVRHTSTSVPSSLAMCCHVKPERLYPRQR